MNFFPLSAQVGDKISFGWCRVDIRVIDDSFVRAQIDIGLINGVPLDAIMKVITHEFIHWTIYLLGGAMCFRDSEPIVKDMMDGMPETIVLDGVY